jgi:hypothetical protein
LKAKAHEGDLFTKEEINKWLSFKDGRNADRDDKVGRKFREAYEAQFHVTNPRSPKFRTLGLKGFGFMRPYRLHGPTQALQTELTQPMPTHRL